MISPDFSPFITINYGYDDNFLKRLFDLKTNSKEAEQEESPVCSMFISLLYLDMRSPRAGAPALMASAPIPTEKSDNQSSFVSPDL